MEYWCFWLVWITMYLFYYGSHNMVLLRFIVYATVIPLKATFLDIISSIPHIFLAFLL